MLSHRNTLLQEDDRWTRLPRSKDSTKTILDDLMMQADDDEEENIIYMDTSKALFRAFYKDVGHPEHMVRKARPKPRTGREVKYNRCLDRVVEYLLTRDPKYLGYVKINFSEEMERIKNDQHEGWEERLKQYQELHDRLKSVW